MDMLSFIFSIVISSAFWRLKDLKGNATNNVISFDDAENRPMCAIHFTANYHVFLRLIPKHLQQFFRKPIFK